MNSINNYNLVDGVKNYPVDTLKTQTECQAVVDACISDARTERLKAIGVTLLTAAACLTLISLAYSVASMATGLLFFPLMILPYVGSAITFIGGEIGVVGCGYLLYTYRDKVKSYANAHWLKANAYDAQAELAKNRKTALGTV